MASSKLGVHRLDPLALEIAQLYRKGSLVTVAKGSRPPPFDLPLMPEWFGEPGVRQVGSISREVRFRSSAFPPDTTRALESRRTALGNLLKVFSYPLADGVRWMPESAKATFAEYLEQADADAKSLLRTAMGGCVTSFVSESRTRVEQDARRMYAQQHPGRAFPEDALPHILEALTARLEAASRGRVLPEICYNPIAFEPADPAPWASPWNGPVTLLRAIAELPRESLTDRRFFWGYRGLGRAALRTAMDVCKDPMFEVEPPQAVSRAETELRFIDNLMDSAVSPRAKCRLFLALVRGESVRELEEQLTKAVSEDAQTRL